MPISKEIKDTPAKTYLFGYPLKRTYAPYLHNTLTRLAGVPRTYEKYETQDIKDLVEESKKSDFAGSAVTMPHKVAIVQYCDDLTPEGKAIGACNTVFWRTEADGKKSLVGHNTDTIGVRDAFLQSDLPRFTKDKTRPGMVVGGGGATRAAVYALTVFLNCSPIYVVNRDDGEVDTMLADFKKSALDTFRPECIHVKTPEQAADLPAPAYIVSAIPDYPPSTEAEKRARATFEAILAKPGKGAILEMCYNPRVWTDICTVSKEQGWDVVTGELAMIWQGIEQQKIWLNATTEELPVQETVDLVSKQVKSDTETGAAPPQS